jgi:hypothetical protein
LNSLFPLDQSDEHANVADSIHVHRECDLNEIDESDSQTDKHDDPRRSRLHGITIDSSDERENA